MRAGQAPGRAGADTGRVLVCATCGTIVTTDADRVVRGGAHEHVKANPHGIVFRIGCFGRAASLRGAGTPERHWSWFPGYAWQVAHCAACGTHLGWLFTGEADHFHGLLLDGLAERDAPS